MKKITHFFEEFFRKYDIWFLILTIVLSAAFSYLIDRALISEITVSSSGIFMALVTMTAGLVLFFMTNWKKSLNFMDFFAIPLFCSLLYFGIQRIQEPSSKEGLVYFVLAGLLLLFYGLRIFFYPKEEQEPVSLGRGFLSKAGISVPICFVLGIVLAFLLNVGIQQWKAEDVAWLNRYFWMGAVFLSGVYLLSFLITKNSEISILDEIFLTGFFLFTTYTLMVYGLRGSDSVVFEPYLLGLGLTFACLTIRSLTFAGSASSESYFQAVFHHFSVIPALVIALLFAGYTASELLYRAGAVFSFSETVDVIIVCGILVVLLILLFAFHHFKSEKIVWADAILMWMTPITLFWLALLCMVMLHLNHFKPVQDVFENSVLGYVFLGVVAVYLITNIFVMILRLTHYCRPELVHKVVFSEEPTKESVSEEPQENASVEETEETPTEESVSTETSSAEETPVADVAEEPEEETPVEASVEESESENITPAQETPVEEADEELSEEESEEDDEDEVSTEIEEEVLPSEPKASELSIVVPQENPENPLKVRMKYLSKLMFTSDKSKKLYSEVKNYMLSYGLKSRITSTKETFRKKGLVSVVKIAGKSVKVYLAIRPEPLIDAGYHQIKDVSSKKQYEETPTLIKLTSRRSVKLFKEIFDILMVDKEIKPKKRYEEVDFTVGLVPNGEAILNALGVPSDVLVPSIHLKMIPNDLPKNLENYVPVQNVGPRKEDTSMCSVYLDTLCSYFNSNDVVTLDRLHEKGILRQGNALMVKARGTMDKQLIIYAEEFDREAVQMIYLTNGAAVRIRHE